MLYHTSCKPPGLCSTQVAGHRDDLEPTALPPDLRCDCRRNGGHLRQDLDRPGWHVVSPLSCSEKLNGRTEAPSVATYS